MSWFSVEPPQPQATSPPAALVHPASSRYPPENLLGQLADEDTSWLAQSSGFVTETQTFYLTLPGGKVAMCQVIHSAIGLWYPQIQFTFRFVDQAAGVHHWKSTNVTNFKTPPAPAGSSSPKYDRRSCKADQFSILLDPAQPDRYTVTGNHQDSVQVDFSVTRLAEVSGWKLGQDARGGLTYFGRLGTNKVASKSGPDYGAGSDGYLVHRFWPRCSVSGRLVIDGAVVELDGSRAIFVHAIQGMRPNLIASRWNFCNFQSVRAPEDASSTDPGVSLTLMEFTTVPGSSYGPAQTISIGSIVVGDKLVGLACSPNASELVDAQTVHEAPLFQDLDTGYQVPSSIKYVWRAPVLPAALGGAAAAAASPPLSSATAELVLDLHAKRISDKESYVTKGLVEKVDVMAQIPYLVKKVISAVAGARPYIYTWLNPVSASITVPNAVLPTGLGIKTEPAGDDDSCTFTVSGHLFNEATFISDL